MLHKGICTFFHADWAQSSLPLAGEKNLLELASLLLHVRTAI